MIGSIILGLILIILALVVYFLPSIIGFYQKKKNSTAIFVLNFFLGWTIIGWIIALIWAVSYEKKE